MDDATRNAIETLVNLLYLIELEAGNADNVRFYVKAASPPVKQLQLLISRPASERDRV